MFRLDLLAVAAGILSAVFSGCGRQAAKPAPVVTVAPVEQSEITEWEEFAGRTEAVAAAGVRPPTDGRRH
jgi:multidrug efflux pump subunit AcrA (membrane-fusion protein)